MTMYPKGPSIPKNLPYGAKHTHARDISYPTPSTEPGHLTSGRGSMPAGGLGESMTAGAMTPPQGSSGPNSGVKVTTQPFLSKTYTTGPRGNP
jgi:hypothetical protein